MFLKIFYTFFPLELKSFLSKPHQFPYTSFPSKKQKESHRPFKADIGLIGVMGNSVCEKGREEVDRNVRRSFCKKVSRRAYTNLKSLCSLVQAP
jgi:hypothetical protein